MKLVTFLFLLSTAFVSCKDDPVTIKAQVTAENKLKKIDSGSYQISCFLNKPASDGFGSDIYTKATMHLNSNGTGSNDFELFSDSDCTVSIHSGTVTIVSSSTIAVGGGNVLAMRQDDGSGQSDQWIAYSYVSNKYYFDVNFLDGESGPYSTLPDAADLSEFFAAPVSQGIQVLKI